MHVGLNAHLLSLAHTYRGAGISRYILNLVRQLRLAPGDDRFTAFVGAANAPSELAPTPQFQMATSRLPTERPWVRIWWEQLVQPIALARHRVDLLHGLAYVQPVLCPCPSVVTILDLSFLRFPQSFNEVNRWYLDLFTRLSVRRARRIIAISASTRDDLVKLLGVPPSKVDVVHLGVEEIFRPIDSRARLEAFRHQRGLPEQFIFFLGTLEPRKNALRLVEAYASLKRRGALPHKLVLGGAKGWLYGQVFARVEEMGLKDDVIFPGYILLEELPLWYNCATVMVYPSLYEGFGLPPLEAMACGTPVIVSGCSALPEVVGEAGLLVDPLDVASLSEAIARVLGNGSLRQELSSKGIARARQFSWRETAQRTQRVYHDSCERAGNAR